MRPAGQKFVMHGLEGEGEVTGDNLISGVGVTLSGPPESFLPFS